MSGGSGVPVPRASSGRSGALRAALGARAAAALGNARAQKPTLRRIARLWGPAGQATPSRVQVALARAGFVERATLGTPTVTPSLDVSDAAAAFEAVLRSGAALI